MAEQPSSSKDTAQNFSARERAAFRFLKNGGTYLLGPYNKDNILGSILGSPPIFGNGTCYVVGPLRWYSSNPERGSSFVIDKPYSERPQPKALPEGCKLRAHLRL